MRKAALVIASLLFLMPATASADDTAAALMRAHHAFVGWQSGDPAMLDRTTVETQTFKTASGTWKTSATEWRHGLIFREAYASGDGTTSQDGYNGHLFWQSNLNGYVHPALGTTAQGYYDADLIFDEALTQVPDPAVVGNMNLDGVDATIVRVTPNGGLPMDVYVDPKTGAFKRIVIDPAGTQERTLQIAAYKTVAAGVKVIGEYRWENAAAWTVSRVTLAPISVADVNPPAPNAAWTFGSDAPVPLEVVAHPYFGSAVVVDASVNGHPGRFLLDSGASQIVVGSAFADRAHLRPLTAAAITGIAGETVRASKTLIDSISIGSNTLHHVVATRTLSAGRFDGIFGYDFLAGAVVDVDLAAHTLSIHNPASYQPKLAKRAYAFPVDLATLTPQIRITLPGNVVAHPIFDSGDDYFLMLADQLRAAGNFVGGLEVDVNTTRVFGSYDLVPFFGGVDGVISATGCMHLPQIDVGPYRYAQAPLCFAKSTLFGKDGGLVGFDFLKHFNWTFDYPSNELILTPNGS